MKAVDIFGKGAANITVTLVSTGPGSVFGTVTAITNSAGIATFTGVMLETVGSYKLIAEDGAIKSAASGSFSVIAGPVANLAFTSGGRPDTISGQPITPPITVLATDLYGNVIANSTVRIGVYKGPVVLSGTLTAVTNSVGVATFTNIILTSLVQGHFQYYLEAFDGSATTPDIFGSSGNDASATEL